MTKKLIVQEHLLALRRGDRAAVEDLYKTAFNYCASYVINNNGSQSDAKDLFQEAIIVLFNNLRKPDFELRCNVKTYLYSVVRNLWLKNIHKKGKLGAKVNIDDNSFEFVDIGDDEIDLKMEIEGKFEAVHLALGRIKEDCKNLLMNYYFNKIPLKDIAVLMEYTPQFVKVKKSRCMDGLKNKVKEIQGKE